MAPISIMHVAWSGGIGGTERHIALIVRTTSPNAFRHHACFLHGKGAVAADLAAEGRATTLQIRNGWDAIGYLTFARTLKRERPDVVHFHTRNLGAQLAARIALPRARRVYTEHAPGALARSTRFRVFYALFARSMHAFVAIAPEMAACMREAYDVPAHAIADVPHAVDIPLRTSEPSAPARSAHIGVVARLERQKRIDLLLDVLAALRAEGRPVRATIVGDGSERAQLEAQARELGLSDNVDFAGQQEDVLPWLDKLDVFVMTSESEPLGLTALEAMARGVPVVAMPCPGGLGPLVAEGGCLTGSRDPGEAATTVARLLDDGALRAERRAAGRRQVDGRTPTVMLERLEAVYRHVLSLHTGAVQA